MQYDFETILDRRGRDALALDVIPYAGVEPKAGFSRIPMWVADMSFPTAPPVLEAIQARLSHPNFGYYRLTDAYYDSIIAGSRRGTGYPAWSGGTSGMKTGCWAASAPWCRR